MAANTKDIQPAVDNLEGKQDGGKTTPKTAAEVLQTVKDLKTSFGDNEAGYRKQIDAIYNRIYADATNDRSLNGLLPALDLADATVDKAGVGNDRGNFSGSDGRDYTQTGVGIDKDTGRALSVISADGRSGMIPGDNGTLQTFTTTGDGAQAQVHVNGVGANG